MSGVALSARWIHGFASLALVAGFLVFGCVTLSALVVNFAEKFETLKERRDQAAALELRIDEYRSETARRLVSIGATPADAVLVVDPEQLRARMSALCAALVEAIAAQCTVGEESQSATHSIWRAEIVATGDPGILVSSLSAAAAPPMRLAKLKLTPISAEASRLIASVEIIGASSVGAGE